MCHWRANSGSSGTNRSRRSLVGFERGAVGGLADRLGVDQRVHQLGLDDLDERVAGQAGLQVGEGGLVAEHAEQVLALAVEAGGLVAQAEGLEQGGELGLAAAFAVFGLDEVEEERAGAVVADVGRGEDGEVGGGLAVRAVAGGEEAGEDEQAGTGEGRTVTQKDRDDAHEGQLLPAVSRAGPVYGGGLAGARPGKNDRGGRVGASRGD
jgi:hypothetical protein